MGDVPFLPTVGAVETNPEQYRSTFSHDSETASAGYYAVDLADHGIRAELTAGRRVGAHRYTFPDTEQANVLIDVGEVLRGRVDRQREKPFDATVRVAGDRTVEGSVTNGWFCPAGKNLDNRYTVYFHAEFDRPFTRFGTWDGVTISDDSRSAGGRDTGAYVTFDARASRRVEVKVGLSYVSVEGARNNLAAETDGRGFDQVRERTRQVWNERLSSINLSGGTEAQRRTFYTALYRTLQYPNLFNDADGRYIGFDDQIHQLDPRETQYANFSGWDSYRTHTQLITALFPDEASDMAASLVRDAEQGGALPRWPVANGYTGVMIGDPAAIIIAASYAYGARDFDAATALNIMIDAATVPRKLDNGYEQREGLADYLELGYVPAEGSPGQGGQQSDSSASLTLEYALADFAIARLAEELGEPETYQTFAKRAKSWLNLFDPNEGLIRPRHRDGSWVTPFNKSQEFGFREGNSAKYTWMIPQDMATLVRAMGGADEVYQQADQFFSRLNCARNGGWMEISNQPSFAVPWVYNHLGQPWKTQTIAQRLGNEFFTDQPDGRPGNDDLGASSAWYVWAALGLYPESPVGPYLSINGPLFPRVDVRLGSGKTLTITGEGAAWDAPYIQSLRVDGKRSTKTWVPTSTLQNGGKLSFELGKAPNRSWGTRPPDAPPSELP